MRNLQSIMVLQGVLGVFLRQAQDKLALRRTVQVRLVSHFGLRIAECGLEAY